VQEATISSRQGLSATEHKAVRALLDRSNAHDGTALLAALLPSGPTADGTRHYLLAHLAGEIVGALTLAGYREVEGCGIVLPECRRLGLGRRLVVAASAEVARHDLTHWLLTCDEAAPVGAAFAAAVGGMRAFAEYRMTLAAPPAPVGNGPTATLAIRRATVADAPAIAAIMAGAFGDPLDAVADWLDADLARDERRWFLASLDGVPVGNLRVIAEDDGDYITAFGVHPAHQRRGHGRALLASILALLHAEERHPVYIEVETENHTALGLYRACGFVEQQTYSYWRVPV